MRAFNDSRMTLVSFYRDDVILALLERLINNSINTFVIHILLSQHDCFLSIENKF